MADFKIEPAYLDALLSTDALKPPKMYVFHVRYRTQRKTRYVVYAGFKIKVMKEYIYEELQYLRQQKPIWIESIECCEINRGFHAK